MEVFVRLVKAVGIALALFIGSFVFALLMTWMKGLFAFLIAFFGLVWLIYRMLEPARWHKIWRQKNTNRRNYK